MPMMSELLSDAEFYGLMLLFLMLALAGAAVAIVWPINVADVLDHPDLRDRPDQRGGDWWR
jgi:hypothetical protein